MNMTEIDSCIRELVYARLNSKEAKQYAFQKIKEYAKNNYGIEITREYVVNLLMKTNKYYVLLQKRKGLTKASQRGYRLMSRHHGIQLSPIASLHMKHRTTIEKIIKTELSQTNRAIKEMKRQLHPDVFRYGQMYNRIYNITKYIPQLVYYDIYNRTHTIEHIRNNTICINSIKQSNRRTAKERNMTYNDYMHMREIGQWRSEIAMDMTDTVTRQKRHTEWKEQLTNEDVRVKKLLDAVELMTF